MDSLVRKKRIGFVTNAAFGIKTGFSRNCQALLSYLYKNRKDVDFFQLVQSFHDKDEKLKLAPWSCTGAFNDEIVNTERFQQDQNYQRFISYGNGVIKDFVLKNELDCLIFIEDIWGAAHDAYWKQDWFDFIKNNTVIWTTLDSLPILPDALEWATKTPNFWVWSDFAEKAMKKIDSSKYSHVKTVYGTLNCDEFKPLPSEEKALLRKKFNINENDIIINMTSRNQLRKLFHVNIEALAKYKKIYQENNKKVKLLFHTSWSEGSGWPLERLRDEFGLEKDDILTSYFCQHCGDWRISPFLGENLDCPNCKKEKSCITAGVTSKISNSDLAKIYGICDAMSHQFTSGGLEYAMVEGLLCGLPLATNGYSCGETFTDQPFVENIDFNLTRECGTSFYKAVPNPNSVAKFFKKIAGMEKSKKIDIGNKGRSWALANFHVDHISKEIENIIDSSKILDWSKYHEHKKNYDVKHPQAVINENIELDSDFVKELYKNILNMDVADDDSGLLGWLSNFSQLPQSDVEQRKTIRKNIEMSFRKIAEQENAKNASISFDSLIDKNRPNKRGLIVIKESMGDCIAIAGILEDFHVRYPDHDLYISCSPQFSEVFDGNPYVYKVIPWHPIVESEMNMIGAGKLKSEKLFDVYLHPAIFTQKILNYLSHSNSRTFNDNV